MHAERAPACRRPFELAPRRVNPLQSDDVVDHTVRRHGRQRLAGANWASLLHRHVSGLCGLGVGRRCYRVPCVAIVRNRGNGIGWVGLIGIGAARRWSVGMGMRRHVYDTDADVFRAGDLALRVDDAGGRIAKTQDAAAGQVGQTEGRLAIPTIGRAEEREKRGILRNGHHLALAKGPAVGGEITREDANFSEKWF